MGQSGVYFIIDSADMGAKRQERRRLRVLIGSFEHTFDAKGRVFIPAKWRESLGDVIIITEGILGARGVSCLFGMSTGEWEAFSEKLSALPLTDMAGQAVKRRLYTTATACELDKQGRILIPAQLRELVHLKKDATLIGVGNRIELWDPADLRRHTAATEADYDDALAHLAQMGI